MKIGIQNSGSLSPIISARVEKENIGCMLLSIICLQNLFHLLLLLVCGITGTISNCWSKRWSTFACGCTLEVIFLSFNFLIWRFNLRNLVQYACEKLLFYMLFSMCPKVPSYAVTALCLSVYGNLCMDYV